MVAVGVVGGVPAEFVPGQLGGLLVVGGDLLAGGCGWQGASSSSVRGVCGQYRFPLAMTAP